jgi:hypothetical protein
MSPDAGRQRRDAGQQRRDAGRRRRARENAVPLRGTRSRSGTTASYSANGQDPLREGAVPKLAACSERRAAAACSRPASVCSRTDFPAANPPGLQRYRSVGGRSFGPAAVPRARLRDRPAGCGAPARSGPASRASRSGSCRSLTRRHAPGCRAWEEGRRLAGGGAPKAAGACSARPTQSASPVHASNISRTAALRSAVPERETPARPAGSEPSRGLPALRAARR